MLVLEALRRHRVYSRIVIKPLSDGQWCLISFQCHSDLDYLPVSPERASLIYKTTINQYELIGEQMRKHYCLQNKQDVEHC